MPTQGLCRKCGRDALEFYGEYVCSDCQAHSPAFDRVVSAIRFGGEERGMVNAFKFQRHLWLRTDFVDFLEAAVRARFKIQKIELITAMPIVVSHRFIRGFNQSECLAKGLAKRLGIRYVGHVLMRIGRPERQGGLDERARRENVKGTFGVKKLAQIKDRTVMVVDDIMTTGSTLSECAAALKRAGAKAVYGATLARSLRS